MKMPSGLPAPVTHNLIIADRSDDGRFAVATILEICPSADDRIGAWHNSIDRFFLFILEQKGGRIGTVLAKDLEHLLFGVLPELCSDVLKLPANVAFDIFVEEADVGAIDDRIVQLRSTPRWKPASRNDGWRLTWSCGCVSETRQIPPLLRSLIDCCACVCSFGTTAVIGQRSDHDALARSSDGADEFE